MFIQTEPMPDPAQMKFLPGRAVLGHGTRKFIDRREATASPLAQRLFAIAGVTTIVLGDDFIVVTKKDGAWQQLNPAILGAIMEHYLSGAPVMSEGGKTASGGRAEETVERIRDALREVIDPELGCNIVDLGLVYAIDLDMAGVARILMTTTTPGCPATRYLTNGAREGALRVAEVSDVEVTLTHDPRWSPARMSSSIKAQFGIGNDGT